jgi:hypothetical protein
MKGEKEMKKTITIVLVATLVIALLVSGVVYASGIRASKATAKVSELTLLEWEPEEPSGTPPEDMEDSIPVDPYEGDWTTILTQNIKTPNQKDLVIDVSLETGLYTRTLVRSKRNSAEDEEWDSSTAHSKIMVRVGVDGEYATVGVGEEQEAGVAFPRAVTFNEREQTLSAKFMGIFTAECIQVDPDTGAVTIIYECLEPEELDLILNTMSANSFNFVVADLTPGNHVITVEAKIIANGSAEEGKYEAMAMVGQGSVVIELVRMVKAEDYLELED